MVIQVLQGPELDSSNNNLGVGVQQDDKQDFIRGSSQASGIAY